MRKNKILSVILSFIMLTPSLVLAEKEEASPVWKEIFVSQIGNDNAQGTKDAPFQTIAKAQEYIRTISNEMQGDIVVNVASGTYYIDDPLHFTTEDSGKNGHRVIYKGENMPVISGGVKVGTFEKSEYDGVWKAPVDGVIMMREMYVNDKKAYVASSNRQIFGTGYYDDPKTTYPYDGMYISRSEIGDYENAEDIEFAWQRNWKLSTSRVKDIIPDPENPDQVIALMAQSWWNDVASANYNDLRGRYDVGFLVKNAFELLDKPGEFYYNKKEKTVYYIPREGEDMTTAEVIAPKQSRLITFDGSGETKDVEITVNDLEIAKKVVCTIERDGMLVSAPAIFIDGEKVEMPTGTPYIIAPSKDIESAVTKTDYFDGLKLDIIGTDTNGVVDSDIVTFSVYDQSGNLIISDAWFADSEFEYRLPGDAPAGEYEAKLSITDAFGNTYKNKYEFAKVVPTEDNVASAIETFSNVTTNEEFKAAYQEHYVTKGTISFSDIPEAEIFLENALGDSFIKMMSARPLWKKNAETNLTVEDIRDCVKAAVIENTLENGNTKAPVILSKYASVLDNVFDGKQNNVYTAELFKTGAQDNETLIYNMKIAAALSQIKNGSSVIIAEVLQNYDDILSVDLEAIEDSGVDILLVAKRLDNTIPDSYKDGLKDEIDKILEDNKIPAKPSGSGSSGSGSGGGGGYSVSGDIVKEENEPFVPKPETPNVPETPEVLEKPEETLDEEIVRFSDVADNFWAFDSIQALAGAEIISGRGNGRFDPDSEVSRAEFATMLVRAFNLISKPDEKPEFTDCRISDWFYPYIDAAISNDIVKGVSATEFAPDASIRRQDACVMGYNVMVCKNYLKFFAGKEFNDSDAVASYAKDAVDMLSGSGVISGFVDGSFGPQKPLSRAQAAVIIHKLMVLLGEEV